MVENSPNSSEDELAFLEAGDNYLSDPSEPNWQRFYQLFKTLIGPSAYLERMELADAEIETREAALRELHQVPVKPGRGVLTTTHGVRCEPWAHAGRFFLKLKVVLPLLILGLFVLGFSLGRIRTEQGTAESPRLAVNPAYPAYNSPVNILWVPVVQQWQGTAMVLVPAGCWNMGRVDGTNVERPVHPYCIDKPFWMDQTEVSNARYGSVSSASCDNDPARNNPDLPRACISLKEAQAYCQAHGERLPTEAEWEWAARGPSDWIYPWGNQFQVDKAVVYTKTVAPDRPSRVGSLPAGASWVGALDMSGNVWEWTSSIYDPVHFPYPYNARDGRENPQDLTSERVLRGGAWNDADTDATTTYRDHAQPDAQDKSFGVRCVRDFSK